jgi:hypothetical protein
LLTSRLGAGSVFIIAMSECGGTRVCSQYPICVHILEFGREQWIGEC